MYLLPCVYHFLLWRNTHITLPTKVPVIKAMVFPVVVCGCERWTIKKAECWRIDAFELWLEKTLESPVDSKEIKSVNPKGNQSWILIGGTDAEAETPILLHIFLMWRTDSLENTDAGKDWRQKENGTTEDEMVGWHHQLNGQEFGKCQDLWWTRRPGMLQSMEWQRVGQDWATELNWTEMMAMLSKSLIRLCSLPAFWPEAKLWWS